MGCACCFHLFGSAAHGGHQLTTHSDDSAHTVCQCSLSLSLVRLSRWAIYPLVKMHRIDITQDRKIVEDKRITRSRCQHHHHVPFSLSSCVFLERMRCMYKISLWVEHTPKRKGKKSGGIPSSIIESSAEAVIVLVYMSALGWAGWPANGPRVTIFFLLLLLLILLLPTKQ